MRTLTAPRSRIACSGVVGPELSSDAQQVLDADEVTGWPPLAQRREFHSLDIRRLGQYGGIALFATGVVLPVIWPRLKERNLAARQGQQPSIEIIIPAYLEHSTIGVKILDCVHELEHYSGEAAITVVASDVQTASAANRAWPNVRVIDTARDGKATAINAAVKASRADVCIVTDANCKIRPNGWLSQTTEDLRSVDLVSCHKVELASQDRFFWLYERILKTRPTVSTANPTLAIVGEYLAFRRLNYRPISPNAICDDISIAIDFAERGLIPGVSRRIYSEEPAPAPADHWERRVRIAHGLISTALPQLPALFRSRLGRQFFAHKLWRVTVGNFGYWMWLILGSSRGSKLCVSMAATTVYATLRYSGQLRPDVRPSPLLAPIAMQTLPPRAMARIVASMLHDCPGPVPHRCPKNAVWRKVSR